MCTRVHCETFSCLFILEVIAILVPAVKMFYKIAAYAYTSVDFYNSPTHKHILSIHCVHFIAKRVHTSTFYLFTVSTSFPSASTSEHLQGTSVHLHRTSHALFFVVATFFPWTKCRLLHEPREIMVLIQLEVAVIGLDI